jgi:hypothetical protein
LLLLLLMMIVMVIMIAADTANVPIAIEPATTTAGTSWRIYPYLLKMTRGKLVDELFTILF